jgi:beta-glucosidase
MGFLPFLLVVFATISVVLSSSPSFAWNKNKNSTPVERAQMLLAEMTMEEKQAMLHGSYGSKYVGYVVGNERLGIPALKLNDGPQGFRDDNFPGTTTCFPSGLTVAATWDEDLSFQFGAATGEEFFLKGTNVLLGPGMNLARVPLNGRNFEYMSGGGENGILLV